MKLRGGKTVVPKAKAVAKPVSKTSAKTQSKSKGSAKGNAKASEWSERKYKKCSRHPKGGVMCAACMMAGHTPTSWREYQESQRNKKGRCHAMPSMPMRRMAPPKR
ncbi:hypothetical protein TrVE_jg2483 [Triparma verrucosa]|uniref:Uncharacterized protein n=1 Tax=Triparma verrucosa TaxID=1606542 RepID=A0A9W7BWG7_9STRA|nr:hypothetical protein TrVE_jg2483 [Triparma verrucosa]